MRKKIGAILFTAIIALGIIFAIYNFLSTPSEADEVEWETLYVYEVGPGDKLYFCNGPAKDCIEIIVTPQQ
jgi:hypothetical protein